MPRSIMIKVRKGQVWIHYHTVLQLELQATGHRVCVSSFLILNNHLHNILLTTLLTKSFHQLHYLQNYSTTLAKRYRKEPKAVSTLGPINIKIKQQSSLKGNKTKKKTKNTPKSLKLQQLCFRSIVLFKSLCCVYGFLNCFTTDF